MKKFLKNYLVSLILGAGLSLALIHGVTRADSSTTVLADLQIPTSQEDTTTLEQRLQARKTAYKPNLTSSSRASLVSKCTLSQSALTDVRAKDRKSAAMRLQVYSDLAKKLSFLVDNLSAQGVDASELLASQNKFIEGINTYLQDAEGYKTAMDDAINVSCQQDPEGFLASVEDARRLRSVLAGDVSNIKSQLPALNKSLSDERQLVIKTPPVKPVVRSGVKH